MNHRGARFPMWSPPYNTHSYPDDKRRYPRSDNLNVSPPSPTSSFQRALATTQVNSSLHGSFPSASLPQPSKVPKSLNELSTSPSSRFSCPGSVSQTPTSSDDFVKIFSQLQNSFDKLHSIMNDFTDLLENLLISCDLPETLPTTPTTPTSPFPTVLAISTVQAITPGKANSTAHLVAGIIQFLLATFPVLSLRLLCSRPLPWPNISPFLQTPWRPPWHFFYSFPQI